VYQNEYTSACHNNTQVQVNFLNETFANSKATWKFLQLHHPYVSAVENETDLAPLVSIVEEHHGVVLNGHAHCLAHFFFNNTNFILSGAAGYPQAGDCNNGTATGPYTLYLAANNLTGESD
jgi:tartrate-resistant acid phosphatase type 5